MNRLKKLLALTAYPLTWPALFATRTAAAVEHIEVLRRLRPETVVDVGANKGQFALAALAAGTRQVISFEPLESEAAVFEECDCIVSPSLKLRDMRRSTLLTGRTVRHFCR
jgi:predicted RNA methylase